MPPPLWPLPHPGGRMVRRSDRRAVLPYESDRRAVMHGVSMKKAFGDLAIGLASLRSQNSAPAARGEADARKDSRQSAVRRFRGEASPAVSAPRCGDPGNEALQATFSRRAASMASAMVAALAPRADAFQSLFMLSNAPSNCRNSNTDGPCPGMDMSHRKSLYVNSLPANSPHNSSTSTTAPNVEATSSKETVPDLFVSNRSNNDLSSVRSNVTLADMHAAKKAEKETMQSSFPASAKAADKSAASSVDNPPCSTKCKARS
mmetsp:Transcript_108974/g.314728  ORF Transcript_108974/g.314728 Transcript_108974/m.314728 type:complete len:261 (-) Transcript_108974:1559-2341(-)